MAENKTISIEVNTNKQILSSDSRIFKTERFFSMTKKIDNIDLLVLKISESLELFKNDINKILESDVTKNCLLVSTLGKEFSFYVIFGNQIHSQQMRPYDIVFFNFETGNEKIKFNDQRVNLFLKTNKIFNVSVRSIEWKIDEIDFSKLYYVFLSEFANFPMLSPKQQSLVKIENENVLVQGVAGSGKTNICISKIIFSACRHYGGKVLYTTFSRALLIDTKSKVEIFKNSIKNFLEDYKNGRIVFLDKDHKKAIENRLGIEIVCSDENNFIKILYDIVDFLETHVDYYLIEDIYKMSTNQEVEISTEETFSKEFLSQMSNHTLKGKTQKLKNISSSVCFKEIYGMIYGDVDENSNNQILDYETYKNRRKNSFSENVTETIYEVGKLYGEYQKSHNLVDNNIISYKMLQNSQKIQKYSLSIIDEVQDFTKINLKFLSSISLKMFCVGDALQMINPTYFSFANLKHMMFREDVTQVAELECNYRNNKKIVEILDNLGEINVKAFGTHSFVLSCESMDSSSFSNAVFTGDNIFLDKLKNQKFENFTILVNDQDQKQELRKIFKRQEILTISEIKGLERDTVLLFNVLSSNYENWLELEKFNINHKDADENSVYRYYFNLFYVGLSRAKHNIFVYEEKKINLFEEFFKNNFDCQDGESAFETFSSVISKIEIDDDEIWERINELIKLGQFENARFYIEKFEDSEKAFQAKEKIDIFEKYVFKGKNKDAGIRLWQAGLVQEAKRQFEISGETKLIEFMESLENKNSANLDANVVKFFADFENNEEAQKLIIEILKSDLLSIKKMHAETKSKLKQFKEKKHG